jgi:hypothetical protein
MAGIEDAVQNVHEYLLCARFKGQTGFFIFLLGAAHTAVV